MLKSHWKIVIVLLLLLPIISFRLLPVFEINDPFAPTGGEIISKPFEVSLENVDNSFGSSLIEAFK